MEKCKLTSKSEDGDCSQKLKVWYSDQTAEVSLSHRKAREELNCEVSLYRLDRGGCELKAV